MKLTIAFLIASLCFGADPLPEKPPALTDTQQAAIVSASADLKESGDVLRVALDVQAALKDVLAKKTMLARALSACPSQSVRQNDKTGEISCVPVPEPKK